VKGGKGRGEKWNRNWGEFASLALGGQTPLPTVSNKKHPTNNVTTLEFNSY